MPLLDGEFAASVGAVVIKPQRVAPLKRGVTGQVPRAKSMPLGDRVEEFLTSYGLTKEFYAEVKESVGLPPGCNCASRQAWLNRFGEKFPSLGDLGGKLLDHLKKKKPT